MISRTQAITAGQTGQTFYHVTLRNADGSPMRAKANGKCKVWKTRPTAFKLPIKHGLYDYGYLDQTNVDQWCMTEAEAEAR